MEMMITMMMKMHAAQAFCMCKQDPEAPPWTVPTLVEARVGERGWVVPS